MRAKKLECKHGHPFNEENTYVDGVGKRHCRECRRSTQANRRKLMPDVLNEEVLARLWSKVDKSGSCWNWKDKLSKKGYGSFVFNGKQPAHRFVYEVVRGPIEKTLVLDHLCRNRGCVNPDHLEVVTRAENTMRGVGPMAINFRKTHCKHGHIFNEQNTQLWNGHRFCRTCNMRVQRERRLKLKAQSATSK